MKIALLVDNMRVTRWQAAALAEAVGEGRLLVYNCRNTPSGRRRLANALYYFVNLFTVRNRLTRSVALTETGIATEQPFDFESIRDGSWQRLPDPLLRRIAADAPDVIVKFGLSLLRVPEPSDLAAPILSYHHGDPRRFRGRPAGFYEVLRRERLMGQIVQILSNRLDAGRVVAFAETKVHPHSYRATLMESYRHSPLLLETAIRNATAGMRLDIAPTGPAFRLPGNATMVRFLWRLLKRQLGRLYYGAVIEKAWRVSTVPAEPADLTDPKALDRIARPEGWTTEPTPRGYTFLADPFFHPAAEGLLVEALDSRTGRGVLLHLHQGGNARLSEPKHHSSYPATLRWDGADFVIPEVSEWSEARIYRLAGGEMRDEGYIDLPGCRILDPTPHVEAGQVYLFGNDAAEGGNILRLWSAPTPFGPYAEHPASPVLISPEGGRMAGAIVRAGSTCYRLGQDGGGDYGTGLIVFRIDRLDPQDYRETRIGALSFLSAAGPHTLNFRDGRAVFDWYRHRFSLAAGFRRVQGRLARR